MDQLTQAERVMNLIPYAECPIGMMPLTDAVSLSPCAHKIGESIAKQYFGIQEDSSQGIWFFSSEQKARLCPLCQRTVTSVGVDHSLRNLVNHLINLDSAACFVALTRTCSNDDHLKRLEKKRCYPGKPAIFVLNPDYTTTAEGNRMVVCGSQEPNSLFQEISFFEKGEAIKKTLTLQLVFEQNNPSIKEYFSLYRISLSLQDIKLGVWLSEDLEEIKKAFAIIAGNNDFSPPLFRNLFELVQSKESREEAFHKIFCEI